MAWSWRYVVDPAAGADAPTASEGFPSQADAETFIGETWRELREQGVTAVHLLDGDREVYGPMSLDPA
jgi:hypothetical protein